MANLRTNGASSSSSSPAGHGYQVFLSFRGKDTRKTFTDHLYTALVQAGIHTFKDEHELKRGEHIVAPNRPQPSTTQRGGISQAHLVYPKEEPTQKSTPTIEK
ncbi:hypothetical protein LguiA_005622 [Lonicera macranthoides]